MCSACRLTVFNICVKFHENMSSGFKVMERTQKLVTDTHTRTHRKDENYILPWHTSYAGGYNRPFLLLLMLFWNFLSLFHWKFKLPVFISILEKKDGQMDVVILRQTRIELGLPRSVGQCLAHWATRAPLTLEMGHSFFFSPVNHAAQEVLKRFHFSVSNDLNFYPNVLKYWDT